MPGLFTSIAHSIFPRLPHELSWPAQTTAGGWQSFQTPASVGNYQMRVFLRRRGGGGGGAGTGVFSPV